MTDHEVRLSTKSLLVAGIDLEFDVKADNAVMGTLSVSQGGLMWRPRHGRRNRGIPITWKQFADWAES